MILFTWFLSSLTIATLQLLSASLTASWNPNPEPDIAGYRLFYGLQSHQYSTQINVGNTTTYTLTNLMEGETYFFAVTAYNTQQMESPLSNEVSATTALISGHISFCNSDLPVPGITVVATGQVNQTTQTNAQGDYLFFLPPGQYTITPIPPPRLTPGNSAINTTDVLAMQQVALGQMIPMCTEAANVDGNPTTNTVDVIATQQFVLGFPAANVGIFGFRSTSAYSFKMYCRGDVISAVQRTSLPFLPLRP